MTEYDFTTGDVAPRILCLCEHAAKKHERVKLVLLDHCDVVCVAVAHRDLQEGDIVQLVWGLDR